MLPEFSEALVISDIRSKNGGNFISRYNYWLKSKLLGQFWVIVFLNIDMFRSKDHSQRTTSVYRYWVCREKGDILTNCLQARICISVLVYRQSLDLRQVVFDYRQISRKSGLGGEVDMCTQTESLLYVRSESVAINI